MSKEPVRRLSGALFIALLTMATTAQGQSLKPVQVNRLAALGRVWNYAKFCNLALVTKTIDWDGALVRAIPKVEGAKTTGEYASAVRAMLAELGDSGSRVESASPSTKSLPAKGEAVTVTGDELYVDEARLVGITLADETAGKAEYKKLVDALGHAKALILDLRCPTNASREDRFYLEAGGLNMVRRCLSGTWRPLPYSYRLHHGYEADSGDVGFNFSQSVESDVLPAETGEGLEGHSVVVILDENTPPKVVSSVLGARLAGKCRVVAAASPEVVGLVRSSISLGEGLVAKVRDQQILSPSLGRLFEAVGAPDPAVAARRVAAMQAPISPVELQMAAWSVPKNESCEEMNAPEEPYRLLALFRFWGVFNSFSPYLKLTPRPWETILPTMVSIFHDAQGVQGYQRAIAQLAAQTGDTHCFTTPDTTNLIFGQGSSIGGRTVDGRFIVVASSNSKVEPGDEILKINGETPKSRADKIAPYLAHSTPQGLRRLLDEAILYSQGPTLSLDIRKASGKSFAVKFETEEGSVNQELEKDTEPSQRLASGKVGYIDLCRVPRTEVIGALQKLFDTQALIVDLRGYPLDGGFPLVSALITHPTTVAQLEEAFVYPASSPRAGYRATFPQVMQPLPGPKYAGKIVVLINEEAVSQAEHTCLMLAAARKVTFIGSPTQGTDGDISNVVLPGGYLVGFSGDGIRSANGQPLQGVGIKPDIFVAPTIDGLRKGRDEVLEAALKYLKAPAK